MLMAVNEPYALMVQPDDIMISPREVDEHFGTGRTSLYRRNFPSYHRKHRRPCWNRARLMQPLWMFFRITLRRRRLPG